MAEDVKERVLRYLTDAHAVEAGGLASLKDLAEVTDDADVRLIIDEHILVTQSQMSRLEARITSLGGDISRAKGAVNTVISKGSILANLFHDREDQSTQDLIKTYALEHFEVGMYTALKSFADSVNDYDTAQIADAILAEEQSTAERILRLIPQVAKRALIKTNVFPARS